MSDGWVKLHRKMLEWEWYDDPNTKVVFLHLLLTANFTKTSYKGIELHPGQTIIGRKALAEKLGLSEQNIRTALKRLKSTNEITIEVTNKFSVVTVVNWASYQCLDEEPTNESTNNLTTSQPATNQQLTSNQPHHKNDKKEKKEKNNIFADVPEEIREEFMDWAYMREKKKKPLLTKRAVTQALNKLNSLTKNVEKQKELINYAIYRNWESFYPIPENDKIPKKKEEPKEERHIEAVAMPRETREKMSALGYGNLIGKE